MLHQPSDEFQSVLPPPLSDEDIRGLAEAEALFGCDIQKGLVEERRLREETSACYRVSNAAQDAACATCGEPGDAGYYERVAIAENTPAVVEANARSDEAGERYHYALLHMLQLPIRSLDDIRDKTLFAIEERDYGADLEIEITILRQIEAFFAGQTAQTFLPAAE